MKLNYRRTVFVGFAFFLICAFWQAYETIIPKILTDKFGMAQAWSGAVMALDNILALFLLPFFGALSDKCKSRWGKRTPFVVVGTVISCCALLLLTFSDAMQTSKLEAVSPKNYRSSLEVLYDANPQIHPGSEHTSNADEYGIFSKVKKYPLQELMSREEFTSIEMVDGKGDVTAAYTEYVVPARQAYAAQTTASDPSALILFIVLLFALLLAMGVYRSPAVALMPDVTPKPLRSKGNAVINLMGAAGGIIVLAAGMLMGTGRAQNALMGFAPFFAVVTVLMLLSLAVFVFTVKEPLWSREAEEQNRILETVNEQEETSGKKKLSKGEKTSLVLILLSVALWYVGYNAVSSKYSVYAGTVLGMDYALPLLIAQAAAIASYIPVGMLSSKVGRKKAILVGVALLFSALAAGSFLDSSSPFLLVVALFMLAGIGWATINVNSFPMVVELATGENTGKYTGYYYTASMAAQTVSPVLSGLFLDLNMRTFFPFAAVFVGLSFVTMVFVRHGDSKPASGKSLLDTVAEMGD